MVINKSNFLLYMSLFFCAAYGVVGENDFKRCFQSGDREFNVISTKDDGTNYSCYKGSNGIYGFYQSGKHGPGISFEGTINDQKVPTITNIKYGRLDIGCLRGFILKIFNIENTSGNGQLIEFLKFILKIVIDQGQVVEGNNDIAKLLISNR